MPQASTAVALLPLLFVSHPPVGSEHNSRKMGDENDPVTPSQRMVNMRQMESFAQRFEDYNEPAYGSRFFSQSCMDNNK